MRSKSSLGRSRSAEGMAAGRMSLGSWLTASSTLVSVCGTDVWISSISRILMSKCILACFGRLEAGRTSWPAFAVRALIQVLKRALFKYKRELTSGWKLLLVEHQIHELDKRSLRVV